MLSILIMAAIAVSVAVGYKTKYNTGLFAIVFAYAVKSDRWEFPPVRFLLYMQYFQNSIWCIIMWKTDAPL